MCFQNTAVSMLYSSHLQSSTMIAAPKLKQMVRYHITIPAAAEAFNTFSISALVQKHHICTEVKRESAYLFQRGKDFTVSHYREYHTKHTTLFIFFILQSKLPPFIQD